MGPVRDDAARVFLRPETAQGIFVNFKNVLQFARKKPPFGIAQIGKAFRNEITPGNFIFRTREFEMMEIEYFVPPGEAETWHQRWMEDRMRWHTDLGIRPDHLRLRKHGPDELSHYSSATSDIEYLFPMGWSELEGIANRGDFDLSRHAEFSGEKLEYFDQDRGRGLRPARDRAVAGRRPLAAGVHGRRLRHRGGRGPKAHRAAPSPAPRAGQGRGAARWSPRPGCPRGRVRSTSRCAAAVPAEYDEGGSIGRRYRRQDEIGTPWGITVDGQTMEDGTVTLRDRDSLEQERVPAEGLADRLAAKLAEPWRSPKLG